MSSGRSPAISAGLPGRAFHDQLAFRAVLDVAADHAVVRAVEIFDLHQVGNHFAGVVDRDREADFLHAGADRHIDADDLAVDVDQRSAAVAGVDGGVGLDQVLIRLGIVDFDVAVQVLTIPSVIVFS